MVKRIHYIKPETIAVQGIIKSSCGLQFSKENEKHFITYAISQVTCKNCLRTEGETLQVTKKETKHKTHCLVPGCTKMVYCGRDTNQNKTTDPNLVTCLSCEAQMKLHDYEKPGPDDIFVKKPSPNLLETLQGIYSAAKPDTTTKEDLVFTIEVAIPTDSLGDAEDGFIEALDLLRQYGSADVTNQLVVERGN